MSNLSCSLKFALCALPLSAAISSAAFALTPMVVGTVSIEMNDTSRARPFTSEVWFEAAEGVKAESFAPLPPIEPLIIARQAKPTSFPSTQPKPLIVMSHGNWATRYAYGWLNTELVRSGYIVLSPSHPGTMNGDLRPEYRARLWERSLDVSFALTQLLKDPVWGPRIDPKRIGFAGHSFGGWAGVNLAGGQYDYSVQLQYCRDIAKKDQYCEGLVKDFNPKTPVADGKGNFKDERIRAYYMMASGVAAGFDAQSLKNITAPMVFDTAKFDTVLAPEAGSTLFAQSIPRAREIVREVGHFSYGPACRPVIGKLLAGQVCTDPDGVERKAIHAQVTKDALDFFNLQLMADAQTEK
jgi:predicted dienelactone hydrolase